MFSNTFQGIKKDFKPVSGKALNAYKNARSAGTAWLDTSRKSLSKGIHKVANVVDAHPVR
jgi:hypothetical protein